MGALVETGGLVARNASSGAHATAAVQRADIDGLRAVAVAFVLVYHAFPTLLGGGFIGVDVFFVISGYLITGIILRELHAGRFSLTEFYVRRVRRIFPALATVMLVALGAGWLLLLPDEFDKLAGQVLAGAGFVSNIAFWRQSGYFDEDAIVKPMLHLWSLGVEEQFYIVWPLLLMALMHRRRWEMTVVLALLAASFLSNILLTGWNATAAFYLPVPRFWELMTGAALACEAQADPARQVPERLRVWGSTLGMAMIGVAALAIGPSSAFPGYWAAVPVGGAALILRAGPEGLVNRHLLSTSGMRYLGRISYPLYLWHWPILSMAAIWRDGPLDGAAAAGALALSLVLAALTYRLIEKPVRDIVDPMAQRRSAIALTSCMCLVCLPAALVRSGAVESLASRFPGMNEVAAAVDDLHYPRDVTLGGTANGRVLMFGDSHMQHYLARIQSLAADPSRRMRTVEFTTRGGCAPVPRIERDGQACNAFVLSGLARARSADVETVVIAASWMGFASRGDYRVVDAAHGPVIDLLSPASDWVFDRWAEDLAALRAQGKRVVIVLSTPRGVKFEPKRMVQRGWMHFGFVPETVARDELEAGWQGIEARLRHVAERAGAEIVNPRDFLCSASSCPTTFDGGRPISTDGSHLRAAFVRDHVQYLDAYVLTAP